MEKIDLFQYIYGTYNFVHSLLSGSETSQILEPLSCLIKLGLLHFKTEGTKISIQNNRIYYQPPSLLQGLARKTNRESYIDLHNLLQPIQTAIKWYNPKDIPTMTNIIHYAIKGLEKLKTCYQHRKGIGVDALNQYISILEAANKIDDTVINSMYDDDSDTGDEKGDEDKEETGDLKYLLTSAKLKDIWSPSQIHIINDLLEEANKLISENNDFDNPDLCSMINATNAIIDAKEEFTSQIILEFKNSI